MIPQPPFVFDFAETGPPRRVAVIRLFFANPRGDLDFVVDPGSTHSCISVTDAAKLGIAVPAPARARNRTTAHGTVAVPYRPPVTVDVWWTAARRGDPFRWSLHIFDDNAKPLLGLNALTDCRWTFDGRVTIAQPLGTLTLQDLREPS